MKRAVIIHGYYTKDEFTNSERPSPSNDHWLPWMQKQLLLQGIEAQTPEMPGFYEPNYATWKEMLERFTPDSETLLIGHSCGGGFLTRWLSETTAHVGNVILVAPWLDPDSEIDKDFFSFTISPDIARKASQISVLYSTDDHDTVIRSVTCLREQANGIHFVEYSNMGHFTKKSMRSAEFPDLLTLATTE